MPVTLPIPDGSPTLRLAFIALSLAVAALFVAAVHASAPARGALPRRWYGGIAAAAAAGWLGLTALLAARGALHFSAPPTMVALIVASLALAIGLAASRVGEALATLPLALLVGAQGFRVCVELLLHRAYLEGLMPVQMSYAGRNFDVVTGLTALALGAWLATGRHSVALVAAWNTLGLALLLNVLGVAMLSSPTPLRHFMNEPSNVWVTRAPWVWLPTVLVVAALLGHAVIYRRLALRAQPLPATAMRM